MESLDYFVGVDWGSKAHQLCIVDRVGSICAQRGRSVCARSALHLRLAIKYNMDTYVATVGTES